ncbi:pectin lyase-like protein [Aspergillus pseudoustus]|uniref:Pectin lyase-like protein n=1 Tax=Aspergillus pseudoustus TaxID=1810923 RepID=A0ABR4K5I4_9EURO
MLQKKLWAILALACTAIAESTGACASKKPVVVHPKPAGISSSTSYAIEVRPSGKSHHTPYSIEPWITTVAEANTTTGRSMIHNTNVANFDFCGSIDITLTYNTATIKSAKVRPASLNIKPQVKGQTIKFSLDSPKNVVVQVNDDIWDVLHILTSNPETDTPKPSDPDVIYFSPGINNSSAAGNLTSGELIVPAGKTVYIAPGATVKFPLIFRNATGGEIRGRGLLQGANIQTQSSSDILIRDILLFNSNIGTHMSSDITIRDLRSFSSGQWGDGIDLYCSSNVLIDNVFMRNSDDNIALYQARNGDYGDSNNLTIQNAQLWADYAHPINIGTHGNTPNPETMDGVFIRNIDVLDHREMQQWYQGALAINAGDSNLIRNVVVDGFRIENFRLGQIVNLRIMNNTKYNTSPGRGIENVYIKDMEYTGDRADTALLLGYDAEHKISNVTFENLVVNGKVISDDMAKPSWYYTADMVPMFANEHVEGLSFIKST